MHAPVITQANRVRSYHSTRYQAVLLDEIQAQGSVQYAYLMAVFRGEEQQPMLIVSSEKSNPLASFELMDLFEDDEDESPAVVPGTVYFFCYFDEKGHFNLGSSPDWADREKFEYKALTFLQDKLGEAFRLLES